MKLTKASLSKSTRAGLIKIGYQEVKIHINGPDVLFVKYLSNNFFLTLGLIKSRYYDYRFTADFYLSKTTLWGACWGDMPREAYKRISAFLTKEEKMVYLIDEFNIEGANDGWWFSNKEGDFNRFIEVVKITESRFLEQNDLYNKIEKSIEVKELVSQVLGVFEIVDNYKEDQYKYQFTPQKKVEDIPIHWFQAAEKVLHFQGGILNKNTVKRLAIDAWTQSYIKNRISASIIGM